MNAQLNRLSRAHRQPLSTTILGDEPHPCPSSHGREDTAPGVFVLGGHANVMTELPKACCDAGLRVTLFRDADSFLRTMTPQTRGCVVIDDTVAGGESLHALLGAIRQPMVQPVILVDGADLRYVVSAMKHGVFDVFDRSAPIDIVLESVLEALTEIERLSQIDRVERDIAERLAALSPRERQIANLLVAGHTDKRIALSLSVSKQAIGARRRSLMRKLGVQNIVELVRLFVSAQTTGLLDDGTGAETT